MYMAYALYEHNNDICAHMKFLTSLHNLWCIKCDIETFCFFIVADL